jgi:hypothetical protein
MQRPESTHAPAFGYSEFTTSPWSFQEDLDGVLRENREAFQRLW